MIHAEQGQFWDNSGKNGLVYVYRAAKAYLQGEKPAIDGGQAAKVAL